MLAAVNPVPTMKDTNQAGLPTLPREVKRRENGIQSRPSRNGLANAANRHDGKIVRSRRAGSEIGQVFHARPDQVLKRE